MPPRASSSACVPLSRTSSVMEHEDAVRALDRRQAMRDHHRRPALEQRLERVLDQPLGLRIDARRRLVEDQDRRVVGQRAREREQLALPGGEIVAPLAHRAPSSRPGAGDELVGVHVREPRPRRARATISVAAERDVVRDVAGEEHHVLEHDADAAAQPRRAATRARPRRRPACARSARRRSRSRSLISVVLPEPVAPTIATVSPGATRNDTSRSTQSSVADEPVLGRLYENHTESNSIRPRRAPERAARGVARRRLGVEQLKDALGRRHRRLHHGVLRRRSHGSA